MAEEKQERAKAFAVRAYPSDSDFFKLECADKYENQQQAFKAFCEAYKNKGAANVRNPSETSDSSAQEAQIKALKKEIELLISEKADLNEQLEHEKNQNQVLREHNGALTLQVEELTQQVSEAAKKSPLNIDLTQENATDLRKIRPFAIQQGIVTAEQYPERITNLAVRYLLENEFSSYIKK